MRLIISSFRIATLVLLVVDVLPLQAQDSLHSAMTDEHYYDDARLLIKTNPLTLLEPDASVELSVEFKPKLSYGLQFTGAYVFGPEGIWQGVQIFDMNGFKTRFQGRLYIPNNELYIAGDVMYKQVWFSRNGVVGYNCEDFICDYYRDHEYRVNRRVFAYHVLFGGQTTIDTNSRIYVDGYVGIGWRNARVQISEVPEGAEVWNERQGWFAWTRDQDLNVPSMMLGVKFGYRIW